VLHLVGVSLGQSWRLLTPPRFERTPLHRFLCSPAQARNRRLIVDTLSPMRPRATIGPLEVESRRPSAPRDSLYRIGVIVRVRVVELEQAAECVGRNPLWPDTSTADEPTSGWVTPRRSAAPPS
jgi:hypothetical protein